MLIGDVPRVNGQLAVARAFGDQSLRAHLSSEPDVKHIQINSSIEFVILASDGLWKVLVFFANFTLCSHLIQYRICYLLPPSQIISRFGISRCINFAMHLDIYHV